MTAPTLTPIGRRRWRTAAPWSGHGVTIPAGFDTDLASIPPVAEAVLRIDRHELYFIVGGIVHDWRYRTGHPPRRVADAELYRIAVAEGAPRWQARLVWAAVRLFGRPAWHRHRGAHP